MNTPVELPEIYASIRRPGFWPALVLMITLVFAPKAAIALSADGWASLNGGTTGGTGGPSVTVSNAADYRSHLESAGTLIVRVSGTIDLGSNDPVKPKSNKTVVGVGTTGKVIGTHILNAAATNIIFKNLTLTTFDMVSDSDAISIRGAKNVWVDHCTVYNCADGLVDMGLGADFVTISWCKFYYTENFGHNLVTLIGSNNAHGGTDEGRLNTTLHHNWYGSFCSGRMPMVRYGKVHAYNNFYNSPGCNMYLGVAWKSQILVENGYFEGGNQNTGKIWHYYETNAKLRQSGGIFVNVPVNSSGGNDEVFTPPYSYTLDDTGVVKSMVMASAGVNGDEGEPVDTAAPVIVSLVPSQTTLWPPNHKMVPVTIAAHVVDAMDPSPTVRIVSVSCNESDNAQGNDWLITGDLALDLRAERSGSGGGRIYLITVEACDAAGNCATADVQVGVPHDSGPDRAAPSVSLLSPSSGADLSGIVTVTARALDVFGVAAVQFKLDGQALGIEDASPPYSIEWDTATVLPGLHTLTAVARDAAGNTATSAGIEVAVADQIPPVVSITAPADASMADGLVEITADAMDNIGVVGVQFKVDGVSLGAEDTLAPYRVSWDAGASGAGSHIITAVARDANNNSTTSAPVTVVTGGATSIVDDFEDGNADGWGSDGGVWEVVTSGSKVYRQSNHSVPASRTVLAGSDGTDQSIQVEARPISHDGSNRFLGVVARFLDSSNYYYFILRSNNTIELKKIVADVPANLAPPASFAVTSGASYTLKLEIIGTTLKAYINGALQMQASDQSFSSGRSGLVTFYTQAEFDNVVVTK